MLKWRVLKAVGILIFFAGMVFGVVAVIYAELQNRWNEPLSLHGGEQLHIQTGDTALGVLAMLDSNAWVHRRIPGVFTALMLRLHPDLTQLRTGYFEIYPGDSRPSVLARISDGRVAQIQLTVVEGVRALDLIAQLRQMPGVQGPIGSQAMITERLALKAPFLFAGEPTLEGAFLPETYRFPRGSAADVVLKRLNDAMRGAITEAWSLYQESGNDTLESAEDLLVLASIIEKETAVDAERTQISGVFHRRMQRGMRLQTDPTVIYGLGDSFDGNLTRKHLRTDTPWNTYTRHGLPRTPICLPGRDSLIAAAQPSEGDSLYFVATGGGRHVFSATLEEHQRAVRKYQLRRQ